MCDTVILKCLIPFNHCNLHKWSFFVSPFSEEMGECTLPRLALSELPDGNTFWGEGLSPECLALLPDVTVYSHPVPVTDLPSQKGGLCAEG